MLRIRGESRTVQAIAEFIKALRDSVKFDDVKLRQYYQDNRSGQVNFKFDLDCAYVPRSVPRSATPDTTGARRVGRNKEGD